MIALMHTFPTLSEKLQLPASMNGSLGIMHGLGFNVDFLIDWHNGPAATSGSRHAAAFVLSVWSGLTQWRDTQLRESGSGWKFDLHEALQAWDDAHRAAFAAWAKDPWWV